MKIHRDHGVVLSSALSARGATIVQQSGVLFMAAYHGIDLPLDGYELREAQRAARDVLAAIEAYHKAMDTADPVITWPRPSFHRQATGTPPGIRGEDVLPNDCRRHDEHVSERLRAASGDDRVVKLAHDWPDDNTPPEAA